MWQALLRQPVSCWRLPARRSNRQGRSRGPNAPLGAERPLLVIGFMGGRVKADNLVHKEAVVARDLQQKDGSRVRGVYVRQSRGWPAIV